MTIIVYFEVWSLAWIIPPKKHLLHRWVVTADNMLPYFAFLLEWQELGLGLTVQQHSADLRSQDHFSRVFFFSFQWWFSVFWSVVGPDTTSLCLKEGMYTCQLPNISWPSLKITYLYVQGPLTSMFSWILYLATLCTSNSALETGFCLCPAKLGWQPINPAC